MHENRRVVVATYEDLAAAGRVVERLLAGGYPRADINLYQKPAAKSAANPGTGEMMGQHGVLVSVRTPAERAEAAVDMMNSEPPTLVQVGGENWQQEAWASMIPGLKSFQRLDINFGE
ncbi:MAG TPA: hypothetical protein VKY39_05010 [Aggregatilineales bacterium]|nr:hypothetical protein [Aggregatilineales bacterium]